MSIRLALPTWFIIGCTSSGVVPDAGNDAGVGPDFKVAYVTDFIHVWHSRDSSVDRFSNYPSERPGYPAFGYDGHNLLAKQTGATWVDVLDTDGTHLRSVSAPTQWDSGIAFATPRSDFQRLVIESTSLDVTATLDRDGSYNEITTLGGSFIYGPSGTTLAAQTTDGIVLMADDGSNYEVLIHNSDAHWCIEPSFSYDGKFLTYACESNQVFVMQTMALDTRVVTDVSVAAGAHEYHWPRFTPDGSSLVYVDLDGASNVSSLWRINLASGTKDLLIPYLLNGYLPVPFISVAPDD